MRDIINNNFYVQRYFDNIGDGYASSKFLSKCKAQAIIADKKRSHYYSYEVKEHISILGIVPFNNHEAYIFNIKPPICYNDEERINVTGGIYEDLMNCYVYTYLTISKELLEKLKFEYYQRGGKKFDEYHGFEKEILKPERKKRQRLFRDEIIQSIFKHEFREVGKNKWSNNKNIVINQVTHQRISLNYTTTKKHTELNISIDKKLMIGSIFALYYININQLSENIFGIVCNKKDGRTYHFTYFEITFKP